MAHIRFMSIFLLFYSGTALFQVSTVYAQQEIEKNIGFRWAFGAMVGANEKKKIVSVTQYTTLQTGDKLKMMVEFKRRCFVYLFFNSNDEKLSMLFPEKSHQDFKGYKLGEKYFLPSGNKWFTLDKKVGLEKIYLLASTERLVNLEELFDQYEIAKRDEKQEFANRVLTEIRKIKKQHKKFTSSAERPVPIGGNVRGDLNLNKEFVRFLSIDSIAYEVSAADFYSRTFTIDHK